MIWDGIWVVVGSSSCFIFEGSWCKDIINGGGRMGSRRIALCSFR